MVESSKILTVSYGTFSCTLEGFDDSFGTMKAIAEYFRDLAQGDRYFGAEPPAPDAEMLTRIAEKEIARRVEARADESGIVLRAVEADKAPAMPPVATPPSVEEVAEVAAPVVEEKIAESTHAATADADGDVAGPEAGELSSPTLVASSPAAPEAADDDVEEMDVTAPAASFADMDTSKITEVPAHPDADSVAAKLQRIRAVVGGSVPAAQAAASEDDMADDVASEADFEEIETASADDMMAEAVAEDDLDGEDENDIDAEEAMSDFEDDAEEFVDDVAEEVTEVAGADDAADLDVADSDDVAIDEDDAADVVAEDEAAQESADVEATDDAQDDDVAADSAPVETAEEEEDAPKQNFRARILRVAKKPVVAEPVLEEETLETDDADAADMDDDQALDTALFDDIAPEEVAELTAADTEGTLSDEDEAELLADLAEVEREAEATKPAAPSGRAVLPEADDAAMSRIMHEADEQLSEPEGSRRRSAIAQLKAAVAATEAARQLGDKGDDAAAKENAFRDDLNEAVRPRGSSGLPRTQIRAERPRPAPLKLVPAQRVSEDAAEEEKAAPVAPRRVAADTSTTDAGSFADFAAEMGASELPDLLEAAAAYTAYVEGIEDFSRPQIMKKVQASATEEFSREDGLRSFGTLLRQGRISKVRNGRFQISEQTRFKPEKKAG